MGRPKKATVDFFPHFVNHGETLFNIEADFGNNGYAFWFKVLEILGKSENHYCDCNNPKKWRYLLSKTGIDEEYAIKILDTLAELDAIDKELWKHKIIWSHNFIRNLFKLYSRRKFNPYTKEDIKNYCIQNLPISEVNVDDNSEMPEEGPTTRKVFDEGSQEISLAEKLKGLILRNNPNAKVPNSPQRWASEFDKMIRIDKRTPEDIRKAIEFSQADQFWHKNILSAGALRKQFDRLYLQNKPKQEEKKVETAWDREVK